MRWQFTDRILHFQPWKTISVLKAGSLEEYSLLERWGEPGQAPAALLLESCIQAARWLVEGSSGFTLTCEPLEIPYWKVLPGLKPGERFCIFLQVAEQDRAQISFYVHQHRVLPGETLPAPDFGLNGQQEPDALLTAALVPLTERCLPADRECLWRELCA